MLIKLLESISNPNEVFALVATFVTKGTFTVMLVPVKLYVISLFQTPPPEVPLVGAVATATPPVSLMLPPP